MDKTEFKNYLDERYFKELKWYDQKSISNQRTYKILQWITIVFTSLTPILIALNSMYESDYLLFGSITSAMIVAIVTALNRSFKFYDNWINYRTICETLKKEIHFHNARVDEYSNAEDPDSLFVKRVESLISRENTLWISSFKKEDKDDPNKTDNNNTRSIIIIPNIILM